MDNSTPGLTEKAGGRGLSNGPSFRRPGGSRPISSTSLLEGGSGPNHLSHTKIIVYKDDKGYGMKVSGDNPVYVQSVKEGGAAERAGLQSGDMIIKVNGVNVTHSTHTEVVDLIKSGPQVVLTVQQRPLHSPRTSNSSMASSPGQPSRPLQHHHSAPARDRITAPQPVDHKKQVELENERLQIVRVMLEHEQNYMEALRSNLARCTDSSQEVNLMQQLSGAERRVQTLQQQIVALTSATSDKEQPFLPLSRHLVDFPPGYEGDNPPPLPSRNPPRSNGPPPPQTPPPLPPRQYLLHTDKLTSGADHMPSASASNHCAGSGSTTGMHTHHRTKSSPDTLTTNTSLAEASKRLISSESMSELSVVAKRTKGGVAWDVDSPRPTPPGTPPPPYGSTNAQTEELSELLPDDSDQIRGEQPPNETGTETSPLKGAPPISPTVGGNFVQPPIISMEDDDMSDQEVSNLEDHGRFKSLSKLWAHHAHLAVFMNYVISNSDPSSLLFYLITDLYKEGNAKEMKKWAYEIHSSFLVPCAPLRLNNVDENVAREIDDVLLNESDKEEILRRIFWKARQKAKEELNEQLADFQQKRTAGLGTLFGPSDLILDESVNDKSKEMKIVETILSPKMEPYLEDIEKEIVDDRRFTIAAALGTIMGKMFGIRGQQFSSLMERCPTFVSKEKSLKSKIMGKTRKVTLKGHHFLAHQYYTVTYCNHCQLIIWGIGPQGYQCTNCQLNIHRHCVKVLDENCPGPMFKKEKGNDRISKLMEKIRPENTRRKPSSLNLVQVERVKRQQEEREDSGALTDSESGDRPVSAGRVERRPDPVRETEEKTSSSSTQHEPEDDSQPPHELTHVAKSKPTATSINRSESYKERIHNKRQLRERRKTSDPNLSKTNNDVDLDAQNLSYHANSGSSSNSSLSTRSLDSPSNSLEAVSGGRTCSESVPSNGGGGGGTTPQWDSDAEAEPDPPDWTRNVPEDVLSKLSPSEKKRQEVINELFHTERSHVRGLKVIDQVFYRPVKEMQILPPDQIQLLFANLEEMLVIHSRFNNSMKCKRKESPVVGDIGDLLLDMFDGSEGETFQRAAATFCARQQIALEALKERRKKDPKLHNFLTDAEGNPMCRRLQLKDIIPTGMLRLTKYPLLFESLAKYTASGTEEAESVLRAVERSKEILNFVDKAVKEAEDQHRLAEIQRRLDKTPFDKADNPLANEFKNLDLTKHRLIHEGALVWRIANRPKPIDIHVLLLEDVIILLQKQDEKFILKFYSTTLSPVIKVSTVLVRPNAVDNTALFLVNTSQNGAQIYDLVATSSSEKRKWFKHFSEAAEAYKQRDGRNRKADAAAAAAAAQHELDAAADQDKTKDSEESANPNELLSPPRTTNGPENDSPSPNSDTTPLPSGESTPQASPSPSSALPDTPEPVTKKLGEGLSPSPCLGRKAAEPLRLTTAENPLIQPSEVLVSQRPVLTAEPVLTPLEKLRRKDEAIRQALVEKQQLVADILHIPREEFETIAELAGEPATDKEASELVLAAVNQANQLSAVVNEALRVTEEEAVSAGATDPVARCNRMPGISPHRLQTIASALNTQLTQLLNIMAERDEERERLRRELQRSREQIHAMHERQDHVLEPSAEVENTTGVEISVPDLPVVQCVVTQEVFVDALSGEAENNLEAAGVAAVSTAQLDDTHDVVE
ncbi:rho guanine nucleotide exchange factor 2 isoform X3 [Lycorma delicatula]|uniref:rho guanine nucleotide exchange factor 2 isoform X3 n=1 Tax=Lycorma delicatula TaxID=130591 RepID=UPI003F51336D